MTAFIWDSSFTTGITDVDEQHQKLVELVNGLGTALSNNDLYTEAVAQVLEQLVSYARHHFEDEELLMKKKNIDQRHFTEHEAEHNVFLHDVLSMSEEYRKGGNDSGWKLHEYLTHWLVYHILGSDQNMARQLDEIGRGGEPQQAYLQQEEKVATATGPLLRALNGLFHQVAERNRELNQLNQSLEDKVAERTEALLKANEDLEILALTDSLTGLPNRRHGMRQLTELWREGRREGTPLSCMMIDADNFKQINDTYGHDAGDAVLVRLALELKHSVRSDDLVCRLGGDEFFIVCPTTPLVGAMQVAENIRSRVSALQVKAGDGVWYGSISVGVAESTSEMGGVDDLLKEADDGVYRAKREGRNCVRTRQVPIANPVG